MVALPPPKWMAAAITILAMVAAVLILAWVPGCKGPYDAAWRTLDGVQKARDLTAQQLAAHGTAQHKACLAKHAKGSPEFAVCIKPARDILRQWQTNVRPAVNSAIQITATAVDIAERVKADPKINWLDLVKPAACALLGAARAWGHYYADRAAAVLAALKFAEALACSP
jgi:hypothetical protein